MEKWQAEHQDSLARAYDAQKQVAEAVTGTTESSLDSLQASLDALGLAEGIGSLADAANALISFARGNTSEGLVSLGAALPGIGMVFGGVKIAKRGDDVLDAARGLGDTAIDTGASASRHVDDTVAAPSGRQLSTEPNGAGRMADRELTQVFNGIKNAPNYPKDFLPAPKGWIPKNVKNEKLLSKLRAVEPGEWKKICWNGWVNGEKKSIHFFQSKSGKVFDVDVKPGWALPGSQWDAESSWVS